MKNVSGFNVGFGSIKELPEIINQQRKAAGSQAVYFIDHFFRGKEDFLRQIESESGDFIEFIDSSNEPTTEGIDKIVTFLKSSGYSKPAAIVGIGGGIVLDTSKAISNLLTNGGSAAEYQGWDLVRVPGIFKVGVPTISGTGAEATRTCVMTNKSNGLKLGTNTNVSDLTV